VVVYEGSTLQADVIRAVLEAAGFSVLRLGDDSAYLGLPFDSGRVLVAAGDAEAARDFLRSAATQPLEPDEDTTAPT
jgi:hypothetical protein